MTRTLEQQAYDGLASWYEQATAEDVIAGSLWYLEAQKFVDDLAREYAGQYYREQIAMVVAVISPGLRWPQNMTLAREYVWLASIGVPASAWKPAIRIGANMRKAEAILGGDLRELSGPKVNAFYRNLCGDLRSVTVDVWHHRAALGVNGGPTVAPNKTQRLAITEATYRLARDLELAPAILQAIIWVTIRARVKRGSRHYQVTLV